MRFVKINDQKRLINVQQYLKYLSSVLSASNIHFDVFIDIHAKGINNHHLKFFFILFNCYSSQFEFFSPHSFALAAFNITPRNIVTKVGMIRCDI